MSDALSIVLSVLGFLLIVFFALLFIFPEELRKLLRRVEAVDAGTDGLSIKFFREQADKAANLKGGEAPSVPEHNTFSGTSILWVDDNPENNFHEAAMFEALGADVRFAKSNASAVEMANDMPPSLLISDIGRENSTDTGTEIPGAFADAGLSLPPMVYYVTTKTEDLTPDGQLVTTLPKELFLAAIEALEGKKP